MKIVNYRRFIISTVLLLLLSSISINMVFSMVTQQNIDLTTIIEHEVKCGETVWEIAKVYCASGDVRDLVYEISLTNNLDNFLIHPGEILLIPIL